MYFLGGFKFPVQETHPWHVKKYKWKTSSLLIKGDDIKSKFGQSGISKYLGLFHMPIFGGLKKYIVLENRNYKNYWNIGWNSYIQILKIYDSKIKLLSGKEDFIAHALSDNKNEVELKVVDFGTIGDGKYKKIRLF